MMISVSILKKDFHSLCTFFLYISKNVNKLMFSVALKTANNFTDKLVTKHNVVYFVLISQGEHCKNIILVRLKMRIDSKHKLVTEQNAVSSSQENIARTFFVGFCRIHH